MRSQQVQQLRAFYKHIIDHTPNMHIYTRWRDGEHPSEPLIEQYLTENAMHLLYRGECLVGAMAVTPYQSEEYRSISWGVDADSNEVSVIHILGVNPDFARQGVAGELLRLAAAIAHRHGSKALRLDTLMDNAPARALYEQHGFQFRGQQNVFLPSDGCIPFAYYEREL